jgi:hypothetical protein
VDENLNAQAKKQALAMVEMILKIEKKNLARFTKMFGMRILLECAMLALLHERWRGGGANAVP